MNEHIQRELSSIKEKNLWRDVSSKASYKINFSTNDYLGYSHHPKVAQAAQDAIKKYGTGGRASRLISGTTDIHRELEEALAQFKQSESSLLFPTGFMANLGVITAILGEGDAVIMDELNHASLWDAVKLSRARPFVYEHASVESLEKILHRTRNYSKRLIVTDSLFSMDGDLAPLSEILGLAKTHGIWTMIDDAHATGVLGKSGIGALEHFGVLGQAEIVVGTLSKALGSQGGFVCGSKDLIDLLINKARSFIYTTALSPANCAAALESIKLIKSEPETREKLMGLSRTMQNDFKTNFKEQSKLLKETATPIVPFWTGSAEGALRMSEDLKAHGICVPAIRPPTVPKNECRLRFSISSEHTFEEVQLVSKLMAENFSVAS